MKKFLFAVAGLAVVTSCSQGSSARTTSDDNSDKQKVLVCYFSATGTTEAQARRIAAVSGGELHEITPEQVYTDADLDWRNSKSRSSVEMNDINSRPAVKDAKVDMSQYDVICIGYPNWWNTAPRVINTFIEANDFEDKPVMLFMTSGGSDITQSVSDLSTAYPSANFGKGLLMNSVTDSEISSWLAGARHSD